MGKVHLINEKRLIKKLFTYGCHDTARGQRMRVENQIHFGMPYVGKQSLDITMATWYNNNLSVSLASFVRFYILKLKFKKDW